MNDTSTNEPGAGLPDPPSRRPRRRRDRGVTGRLMFTILAVAIVAVAVWWWQARSSGGSQRPEMIEPPAGSEETVIIGESSEPPSGATVATDPFPELPELAESDPWIRDRATELSRNARWLDWLAADGLVRRFVIAVVNVAGGESPAEQLPFLQPADTFRVVVRDGRTFADPANGRRYDGIVRALTSLDARATARFYRGVGPLIDAAWRPLGFVDRDFDDAAREAVRLVLDAEAQTDPVEVVQDGIVWAYAAPELEERSPASKHLMRLGSSNLLRLQDWVRTFADASGIGR